MISTIFSLSNPRSCCCLAEDMSQLLRFCRCSSPLCFLSLSPLSPSASLSSCHRLGAVSFLYAPAIWQVGCLLTGIANKLEDLASTVSQGDYVEPSLMKLETPLQSLRGTYLNGAPCWQLVPKTADAEAAWWRGHSAFWKKHALCRLDSRLSTSVILLS